jgi:hypothetical protein
MPVKPRRRQPGYQILFGESRGSIAPGEPVSGKPAAATKQNDANFAPKWNYLAVTTA